MGEHASRSLTRRTFLGAAAMGIASIAGCSASDTVDSPMGMIATIFDRGTSGPTEGTSGSSSPSGSVDTVNFLMIGDILLHTSVYNSGLKSDGTRNYDHLFAHVKDLVDSVDVAMLDQETILGGTELGLSNYPLFNGPHEVADAEVAAGFTVALGATNHALDMGMAGIASEAAYWRDNLPSVLAIGRYDSQEAYDTIGIVEAKGHRIAILNYTAETNGIPLPEPYALRLFDMSLIQSDIEAAWEAGAEAVIVAPHWGVEYSTVPTDEQRSQAQQICDMGASAILGNHPHAVQPAELYTSTVDGHSCPVFFSVGNFVSGQERKASMIGSAALVTLEFSGGTVTATQASLEALVTHKARTSGDNAVMAPTTYLLADYTEELAQVNGIREISDCSDFSRAWCVSWCEDNLPGFNPETCSITVI